MIVIMINVIAIGCFTLLARVAIVVRRQQYGDDDHAMMDLDAMPVARGGVPGAGCR